MVSNYSIQFSFCFKNISSTEGTSVIDFTVELILQLVKHESTIHSFRVSDCQLGFYHV